jgi:hypothetical protein
MVKGGIGSGFTGSYREPLHERGVFQYIKLVLIIATLVVGVLILLKTNQITGAAVAQQTISIEDFLSKLTVHPEAQAYVGISPLNVIQISSNNLPNLQTQIAGLDTSYLGSFLVQYADAIVVYDYNNDAIKGIVRLQQPQQAALPADFSAKLNAHPELSGLENEQPVGGQLDANSLSTLQQQFPNVYADAKVGDFLLRYSTRLIIYDYNNDAIVNAVNLG